MEVRIERMALCSVSHKTCQEDQKGMLSKVFREGKEREKERKHIFGSMVELAYTVSGPGEGGHVSRGVVVQQGTQPKSTVGMLNDGKQKRSRGRDQGHFTLFHFVSGH